jgi:hypothetical protein
VDGVLHDARGQQSLHDLQEEQLTFFFGARVEQVTIVISAAENGQNFATNSNRSRLPSVALCALSDHSLVASLRLEWLIGVEVSIANHSRSSQERRDSS